MIRSSGSIARATTCSAEAPEYCTNISTMGTEICGSSCRGVMIRPIRPISIMAMYNRGDSGETIKNRAVRPARRSCSSVNSSNRDSA